MTKKDAETLLKYGAYDFFKEEREGRSDELSNAFCEADIDQILEKNTKVITIDSQGGSSFSKASFITDTSMEVDINDPNFWTKVVGLKPQDELVMGPRSRKKLEYDSSHEKDAASEPAALVDESEWTKADRDAITQVIYNLLDNAIKFCPVGGSLALVLEQDGQKARLRVRNTGQTIPAEELPLLFDRFHKADKARSADREGWGLGLYIAKTIGRW